MKSKRFLIYLLLIYAPLALAAQMNYWALPPSVFQLSTQSVTALPGAGATPYVTSNSAFDDSGNLLFYVLATGGGNLLEVHNAAGNTVGTLNALLYACNTPNSMISYTQQEIAIVPVPGACKQYYVIWWYANPQLTGQTLGYAKIDANAGVSIAQQSTVLHCDGGNSATLAVTKKIGSNRYLLSLGYSGLRRYTITNTGIINGTTIAASIPNLQVINEMEINANGNRILYGDPNNGTVYVVSVSVGGGTSSGTATYSIPGNHGVKGVEFNASGNMFYACTSGGLFWATTGAGGTMTAIPNSSNYTNSHIEYGKDGFLYVVSNTGALAKMHPTTMVITPLTSPAVNINSNEGVVMTGEDNYRLPDQIDGELYDFAPCGVTVTASQTLLNASCMPVYIAGSCPGAACMRMRICLNIKNTGNCVVNAGGSVLLSLDPRLKICNAGSTASASLVGVFGGSTGSTCTPPGCCAFTANTNLGPVAFYNLLTPLNPDATISICVDVQTYGTAIDLCNNPLVSTAVINGTCQNGTNYSKTTTVTYRCCNDTYVSGPVAKISAMPLGCGAQGAIRSDETLTYTVSTRTNSVAVNAVLLRLDANLDWSTLDITSVTEGARTEQTSPSTLKIMFDRGEGEVTYNIRPLPNLPEGTVIASSAEAVLGNGLSAATITGPIHTISDRESLQITDMPVAYFAPGCSGPITLTPEVTGGNPRYQFEWSTGDIASSLTVQPAVSTGYSVRAKDASGCVSAWKSTAVIVGPMAIRASDDQMVDPAVIGSECAELSILAIEGGTPPFDYAWSDGSTGSTTRVCPTADENIRVSVTDANGCVASDDIHVYVNNGRRIGAMPSVANAAGNPSLTAIPNPFTTRSTLRFSLPGAGFANLTVYDHLGKEVAVLFNGQVGSMELHEVDFAPSGLSAGIYFARLTDASGKSTTVKLAFDR